ncbi:MAG: hypothetical protein GWO24_10170, partial [Akkermansiaceae bacterium]|nr:hypothetical protein [Akkermansiaceae bacterium]
MTLTEEIRDSRLWAGGALCELGYGRFSQTLSRRLEKLLTNDLEATASRLCPAISRLRDKLADAGASVLGMSGSGPTMFALFGSPE